MKIKENEEKQRIRMKGRNQAMQAVMGKKGKESGNEEEKELTFGRMDRKQKKRRRANRKQNRM